MPLISNIFCGRRRAVPGLAVALGVAFCAILIPLPATAEIDAVAACAVPQPLMKSNARLTRVATRLARSQPIRIVALGSSSTSGAGASSPQTNYPSRMQEELARLLPATSVTVLNKGVSGERVGQMLARLQRDVLDEQPDLLVWQVGTNSALSGDDPGNFLEQLTQGLDQVRKAGIDVVLMTPQFSPRFENTHDRKIFIDQITTIAELRGVPVVRRYEMMKHWVKSGQMTTAEMVNPDGLHLTDRSYACIGKMAAKMVVDLSDLPRPTAINTKR